MHTQTPFKKNDRGTPLGLQYITEKDRLLFFTLPPRFIFMSLCPTPPPKKLINLHSSYFIIQIFGAPLKEEANQNYQKLTPKKFAQKSQVIIGIETPKDLG